MKPQEQPPKIRQRAPSKRSLETRERILDAAEKVFAKQGFDGATLREIAACSGEVLGLVHHHGHGKEMLFEQVVARRAQALATARLCALQEARIRDAVTVEMILGAFFGPFLGFAQEDARWLDYGKLIAHVSVDPKWRSIAQAHFDPTARVFVDEIELLLPGTPRAVIAKGFIFAVSAMLAHVTSGWRVEAIGDEPEEPSLAVDHLVTYCAAGIVAAAR